MADEPMSDERLAEIYKRASVLIPGQIMTEYDVAMASRLLAEVERLRALVDGLADDKGRMFETVVRISDDRWHASETVLRLQAQISMMRPIVEAVADIENSDGSGCYVTCDLTLYDSESPDEGVHHDGPCIIEQARAYVAAHPATGEGD